MQITKIKCLYGFFYKVYFIQDKIKYYIEDDVSGWFKSELSKGTKLCVADTGYVIGKNAITMKEFLEMIGFKQGITLKELNSKLNIAVRKKIKKGRK